MTQGNAAFKHVPTSSGRARTCPVCDGQASACLFENDMAPIAGIDFSYRVVACSRCGMVHASEAPDDTTLQRYYATLSKYDHPSAAAPVDAGDQHRAEVAAGFTRRFVDSGARVLDVGCSTGVYLAELARGDLTVRGLDPSPISARVAKECRGIDVDVASAYDYEGYADFDAIALLAVLEHLREPRKLLASLARQMKEGATLIVEVPDAGRFGDYPAVGRISEPFGEFSNEHINYFGVDSLSRLAADVGLAFAGSEPLRYLAGITGLLAAFKKESACAVHRSPDRSADSVRRYVAASRSAMTAVEEGLDRSDVLAQPFVLYGAGSHSARMLAQGSLGAAPVAVVLDRNPHLAGEEIGGHRIEPPAGLQRWPRLPVVVSSFHAMAGIAGYVRSRFENDVVTLYPEVVRAKCAGFSLPTPVLDVR